MGRGKVVMRRIDDKTVRKVTFSKRRQGFFKKARELAVLCDAEVAAIVFSSTRRSYSSSHPSSIEVIVQRYNEHKLSQDGPSDQVERGQCLGDPSVGAQDNLQTTLGFFMNQSFEDLNLREIVQLECQLYEILKQIIHWKFLPDASLQNQMIEKSNKSLQDKVEAAALPAEKEVVNEDALRAP